jgi:TRAP-type transport system periplasmic protein
VPLAGKAAVGDKYTMRVSITQAATSVQGIVLSRLAAAVDRRSNGQLKIELYPNGQLAKEQEAIDSLSTGILDLASMSSSWLVQLFPRYQVFDMPFLFKDIAAGYRVLDGPLGDGLLAELGSKGIVGLGWGAGTFKEIETATKPVTVPDDMKGLRIRIVGGAVYVATYQALGAIPIAIDASEISTALAQHAIDAIDPPIESIVSFKFYTAIKHVAMSNHVLVVNPLLGSKRKIDALPLALQTILRQEAKAVIPFWRSIYTRALTANIETLKKNGVAFNEPDHAAFRKAVEPVYATLDSKPSIDLIEQIGRATAATTRR